MPRKLKYSQKQKVAASIEYLSGTKKPSDIARSLNMGKQGRVLVRLWAKRYQTFGPDVFAEKTSNPSYSEQFKKQVVAEYLSGRFSFDMLCLKYNISTRSTVTNWVKKYNNHIEIKDYDPKPEVYMANTLKTTFEERINIVKDCLAHNRDIKGTAEKYGCNYAQLYQWVRKYEDSGEEALTDKRGKRKLDSELSEIEKAQRRIAQLKREKEEYRKKYELLKKAEERERW